MMSALFVIVNDLYIRMDVKRPLLIRSARWFQDNLHHTKEC